MATVVSVLKDVTFALRQHALLMKQMSNRVQIVSPIEPLKGGWSSSNNFGQSVLVETQSNVRKAVLKLPEWGMPETWTIMLGLDHSKVNYAGGFYYGLTAEIEAGCGGALQTFQVDWRNGTLITVPMNALSVVVKYDIGISDFAPPAAGTIRVTSTVSRGARSGGNHPVRTIAASASALTIANGAYSSYIEIPPFATKLALGARFGLLSSILVPGLSILWCVDNVSGTSIENVRAAHQLNCMPEGLMVPGGAYYVRLYNDTGSPIYVPNYRFTIGV